MGDVPTPLVFVEPKDIAPVNVCLYGPPGSGKTVAACSAPGPLLVLNAEGSSGLRFARRHVGADKIHEVEFKGQATLDSVRHHLQSNLGEQTLVVDSVGEVYAGLLRELGGLVPSLQQYGRVNAILTDFVRSLRDFPIHVVLVCHEQIEDSDEGGATRRPQTGGAKLPEVIMGMMDVVAYCSVLEGDQDDDPVRYVGQVVQARGRRAKDRSGALGAWRDLDLTEWFAAIDTAYRPTDLPWEQPAAQDELSKEAAA
jgi:hypothetical protein